MMSFLVANIVSFVVGFFVGTSMHDNIDISAGKIEVMKGEIDDVEIKITDESETGTGTGTSATMISRKIV